MTFRIHISATGPGCRRYVFEQEDLPYGDDWELSRIETQLLQRINVSAPPSPTGGSIGHLMDAASSMHQGRILAIGLGVPLAAQSSGRMLLGMHHSHFVRPDTGGTRTVSFGRGYPLPDSIGGIFRFLHDYDMAKWTPVLKLLEAGIAFGLQLNGHGWLMNVNYYD